MSIADELAKLEALRRSKAINEDEFVLAKAKLLTGTPPTVTAADDDSGEGISDSLHRLARATDDCVLGGVCGGLGKHTALPSWAWRVIFLLLFLLAGTGVIMYIVLWICMPVEKKP